MDTPDNKNAEMREKAGPRRALLKTARLSLSGARKDRVVAAAPQSMVMMPTTKTTIASPFFNRLTSR